MEGRSYREQWSARWVVPAVMQVLCAGIYPSHGRVLPGNSPLHIGQVRTEFCLPCGLWGGGPWSLPWSLHLLFAGLLHAKEGVSLCTLNSLSGAHHMFPGQGLFPTDGSWQHRALGYCHLGILPAFSCCSSWCNLSGQDRRYFGA